MKELQNGFIEKLHKIAKCVYMAMSEPMATELFHEINKASWIIQTLLDQLTWKYVEDSLPEEDGWYFVKVINKYEDYSVGCWENDDWLNILEEGLAEAGVLPMKVTHWLPIPKLED